MRAFGERVGDVGLKIDRQGPRRSPARRVSHPIWKVYRDGYAWSSLVEGSETRRFFAVLRIGAIESPVDAVRAAIVAEHNGAR
jgi:hypothetical protein